MPETPNDIENLSPYKLLHGFSKNRVFLCMFGALIIHVLVIGGLSADYIYSTWIDPTADSDEKLAGSPNEPGDAKPGDTPPAETPPGDDPKDPTTPGDPREDAPVVGRVTDKPDPDTIPKQPGGLGISIDDLED